MKIGKRGKKAKSPFVRDENPELRQVVRGLCGLLKGLVPGAKQTLNSWGIPTFESPDPFCFYLVGKNHVTLGFHFGTSLPDPESLLEGTGKNIRHVKLREVKDLKRKGLRGLVQAAARLKGKEPMKGMSGKRKPV